MLNLYKTYLEAVDSYLLTCFESQKPFIKCQLGCAGCCEIGEYPFSRLEMEYLMAGFPQLMPAVQSQIRAEIKELLARKRVAKGRFLHKCPFLSPEKNCYLYDYRGLVCRAFGLASFEFVDGKKIVKLPECARVGLNYSEVFDGDKVNMEKFQELGVPFPIKHSLSLNFFHKELSKGLNSLEFGEIRPLLDWFS